MKQMCELFAENFYAAEQMPDGLSANNILVCADIISYWVKKNFVYFKPFFMGWNFINQFFFCFKLSFLREQTSCLSETS